MPVLPDPSPHAERPALSYPILEFDPSPEALLEPARLIKRVDVPERCVLCFFQDVIAPLAEQGRAKVVATLRSEIGKHPIYQIERGGERLVVAHPGVGAPLVAAILEEIIALGCRKFLACGGAGVLNRDVAIGHLIVPVAAVRDEGTSYHYLPPAREVEADGAGVAAVERALTKHGVPYTLAKTWTTDAIYRETTEKIRARRAEGCVTVEMEAAAFFAVARFRAVRFAQILYAGDDCSGDLWDSRQWHAHETVRERLFWLACDACLEM
jgi:uridine phosphorylase